MKSRTPFLSIVVPVLNEAPLLPDFLRRLRQLDDKIEIIVVDGGSTDGTSAIAAALADEFIATPPGRSLQMNAGAAIASGEVLWFVHADSQPAADSVSAMRTLLHVKGVDGGCFSLRYPRREWIYRVSDSLGNVGVKIFGFALGDHGIFCRRRAFLQAGGYPDVPILEDAELWRRLRRRGRMKQLRETIVSSPRIFEARGRYRTTFVYLLILALYVTGVPIALLYRIYRGHHRRAARSATRQTYEELCAP